MKTLRRIRIKDENILGKEELKNLKGGYWEGYCWIYCEGITYQGPGQGESEEEAERILMQTYNWCNPFAVNCS